MKPPVTPSRFETSQRHYHHRHSDDPEAWNNWVGGKKKTGRGLRIFKRVMIIAGVLAFIGLVALMIYQMS